MKRLLVVVLFLAAGLSACKKEAGLRYPASYLENHYHNTTPVRMYTGGGEVKNENLLKAFIRNYDNYNWYQPGGISESVSTGDEVVLKNEREANFITGGSPFEYDLQVTGNNLLFTSKEERRVYYGQNDEYKINLLIAISKHKPLIYDKEATAQLTGFEYSYKTKERAYGYQIGTTLEFPRLLYMLKTGTSKDFQLSSLFIDNDFDPSVLAILQDTDTLVVQEFVRVYQKK